MTRPLLTLLTLFVAGLLAACGDRGYAGELTGGPLREHSGDNDSETSAAAVTTNTSTVDGKDPNGVGPLPETKAKDYFVKNVAQALKSCGGCHSAGPGPMWDAPADADKTYTLVFGRGYITRDSMLIKKGAHSGGSAPALSPDQHQKVAMWIELEMKERGDKAPPSVLAKLGDCLDADMFKAIGFEDLMTITRTADNNPTKQTEDADDCIGCKPADCATCHSSDPGSGFVMALNNTILDESFTFTETKKSAPYPYLQKYFGLDPNGDPIASHAIRAKSDNTVNVAKAYEHPMFKLDAKTELALNNFVEAAITKYKAGECGK